MALTKAKVSFVEGLDGAVLTGAMPAVDGASLTGIAGMTKETSDPLITTNPATGVGTVWLNKSTSELFGCTDATTDENVWVNIGSGAGYAISAARAFLKTGEKNPAKIVLDSLQITADLCIYTNDKITVLGNK